MTVSLELAKKLKEAGWDTSVSYMWLQAKNLDAMDLDSDKWIRTPVGMLNPRVNTAYYAPSTDELLEVLPARVEDSYLCISKVLDWYCAYYEVSDYGAGTKTIYKEGDELVSLEFKAPTPSDALAKLWLKLKEEGII